MARVLSQEEIDNVFRAAGPKAGGDEAALRKAPPFDFRRPDRIPKEQLRAVHLLHENFARTLASSLSAYLRAYVVVNLVSVEQLSYLEFTQCLPSPTCLTSLSMQPVDGNMLLELNPSLVFPILEMLLGGDGRTTTRINREITEIEQTVLDSVLRIMLNDMKMAWQSVSAINFQIERRETDPQLLQLLSPNEAVVAISMEVRVGQNAGMMNLGIPSIVVKMLRQRFDQQWSVRRTEASEADHARMLRRLKPAPLQLQAHLQGPTLVVEDLLNLKEGDILAFDYPVTKPVELSINGRDKFLGHLAVNGPKRVFQIADFRRPSE